MCRRFCVAENGDVLRTGSEMRLSGALLKKKRKKEKNKRQIKRKLETYKIKVEQNKEKLASGM